MKLMEKEIEEITRITNEIYSISKNQLSTFYNQKFKSLENILGLLIMERIIGNLNSTRILLINLIDQKDIEHSIGLILRNNLSLCKIVFRHNELKCDNNAKLDIFYKTVFGENINRSINYVKKYHTNKELQTCINNIKKNYPFLLSEIGLDLNNIGQFKFDEKIIKPEKCPNLENLFNAYSKYEHFGLNTLILQSDNESEEQLARIKISIHYSLQGVILCLSMLNKTNQELMIINENFNSKN